MEQMIQKQIPRPDGGWLVVDQYGATGGPMLVIVPGVMSDSRAWANVAQMLTAWTGIVVLNRRGRAPSSGLPPAYSLETEVEDLLAVYDEYPDIEAVFGWSYGGLIAMSAASIAPIRHLVAYEPVAPPFGQHAVSALRAAGDANDLDGIVDIVLGEIAEIPTSAVDVLRADDEAWSAMRAVAAPIPAETIALGDADLSRGLARRARRVDLVVGGANRGRAPYGTTFEDVRIAVRGAVIHALAGAGHMVHLDAPRELAALIDSLRAG